MPQYPAPASCCWLCVSSGCKSKPRPRLRPKGICSSVNPWNFAGRGNGGRARSELDRSFDIQSNLVRYSSPAKIWAAQSLTAAQFVEFPNHIFYNIEVSLRQLGVFDEIGKNLLLRLAGGHVDGSGWIEVEYYVSE